MAKRTKSKQHFQVETKKIGAEQWSKYTFKFKIPRTIHDEIITEDTVISKDKSQAERILLKSHVNLTRSMFTLSKVEDITLFDPIKEYTLPEEDRIIARLDSIIEGISALED